MILPTHTMYDGELLHFVEKLHIPNFRGVKMRDELPKKPHNRECGILNFNTHLLLIARITKGDGLPICV